MKQVLFVALVVALCATSVASQETSAAFKTKRSFTNACGGAMCNDFAKLKDALMMKKTDPNPKCDEAVADLCKLVKSSSPGCDLVTRTQVNTQDAAIISRLNTVKDDIVTGMNGLKDDLVTADTDIKNEIVADVNTIKDALVSQTNAALSSLATATTNAWVNFYNAAKQGANIITTTQFDGTADTFIRVDAQCPAGMVGVGGACISQDVGGQQYETIINRWDGTAGRWETSCEFYRNSATGDFTAQIYCAPLPTVAAPTAISVADAAVDDVAVDDAEVDDATLPSLAATACTAR